MQVYIFLRIPPADRGGSRRAIHGKHVSIETDGEAKVLAVRHHWQQCPAHEVTVAGLAAIAAAGAAPSLQPQCVCHSVARHATIAKPVTLLAKFPG